MNITKTVWDNYYKLPDIIRQAVTLTALVGLCICNPPIPILSLTGVLFIGLAIWSLYYKANKR